MSDDSGGSRASFGSWLVVALAWALVGLPLGWGVWKTLLTAVKLFR